MTEHAVEKSEKSCLTVGYGNRPMPDFLNLLNSNNVQFLIDVRSKPFSSFQPDFSKEALKEHLERVGIRYLFMGDQLGGRPKWPSVNDRSGKVDYKRVEEHDFYKQGISRIVKALESDHKIALLCSELKPERCHRSKLIGESLRKRGISVLHIDEHDDLVSQDDVMLRLTGGQHSMLDALGFGHTSRESYRPPEDHSDKHE